MPSGHSIAAGFMCAFLYLYINENYKDTIFRKISIITVLLFSISIGVSRIVLNCHTVQQVIMGSIIGVIFGIISYKKKYDILDRFNIQNK